MLAMVFLSTPFYAYHQAELAIGRLRRVWVPGIQESALMAESCSRATLAPTTRPNLARNRPFMGSWPPAPETAPDNPRTVRASLARDCPSTGAPFAGLSTKPGDLRTVGASLARDGFSIDTPLPVTPGRIGSWRLGACGGDSIRSSRTGLCGRFLFASKARSYSS